MAANNEDNQRETSGIWPPANDDANQREIAEIWRRYTANPQTISVETVAELVRDAIEDLTTIRACRIDASAGGARPLGMVWDTLVYLTRGLTAVAECLEGDCAAFKQFIEHEKIKLTLIDRLREINRMRVDALKAHARDGENRNGDALVRRMLEIGQRETAALTAYRNAAKELLGIN